jgi:DHA1 family bicyclomycin/chloramphenicol resistance-like MFS transporter
MLIDAFGWRTVFWFALVTGSAIMLAAWLILYETRGPAERAAERHSIFSLYFDLLRNRSFVAFVLQSGFMSFSFFAIASASPFLMSAALGRSATEFGLYFMLFPAGFCIGNIISSRLSGKANIETMVVIGAFVCFVSTAVQTATILAGYLSPLIIFAPGGVMSFAQGLCLPNAQAGAIRVRPALAGTAAGLGVFIQMLLSALSTQLYGLTADGTAIPMIAIAMTGAALAMLAAIAAYYAPRPQGAA